MCKVAIYRIFFLAVSLLSMLYVQLINTLTGNTAKLTAQAKAKFVSFACKILLAFFRSDLETAFMSIFGLGFSSWADCHLGHEDRYPLETRMSTVVYTRSGIRYF